MSAVSTFTVRLPPADRPADTPGPVVDEANNPLSGLVVLLVEDDASVRRVIRQVFVADEMTVVEAGSAEDALIYCQDGEQPDLILSDAVLPDLGGPALLTKLRARWPDLEAILMSGHPEDPELVAASGAAFLAKPFTPRELQRCVANTLRP